MQQAEAISSFDAKLFVGEGVMLRSSKPGALHQLHCNSTFLLPGGALRTQIGMCF